MSIQALSWAFDRPVMGAQKPVLLALANHADINGAGCYPSMERIAFSAGISTRGARKALRELEKAGLICTIPRAGRSSTYRLMTNTTPEPRSGVPAPYPGTSFRPTPERGSAKPSVQPKRKSHPSGEESVSARAGQREGRRRVLLGRLPPAREWRRFATCESEPDGPAAICRPCIKAEPGTCGLPEAQIYPLDGFDGLPNEVFENALIDHDGKSPIDWTPLFDWVREGIPRETILEAIKATNAWYRGNGFCFPVKSLGFYAGRVRLLAAEERNARPR